MDELGIDRILAGLNAEQREAVVVDAPTVVIRAGAGSGKTRVLTRRIAHRAAIEDLDPRRVLALTFTRKAAGELNQRLRQLGLRQSAAAGTFHAIALAQLRQHWEERGTRPPGLLDRKYSFVNRLLGRSDDRVTTLDVIGEIEWAKARRIAPDGYERATSEAGRTPPMSAARIADIYAGYESLKTERNVMDFDDILVRCGRLLQRDADAAAAFRWKHRHVFVDEFQDVNPLQFALLKVIVGPTPDLCVVGDSRQAIYAWNGADSQYLDHFEEHFPGSASVELRQNYRSTPEILTAAAALLPNAPALEPVRASGEAPSITAHADADAEAEGIARALRHTHSGRRRWSDMAVLVRTNAQVVVLTEACRRLDVPINARTDARLIERPDVQDAIDSMGPTGQRLGPALDDLAFTIADEPEPESPALAERRAMLEALIAVARDHLVVDPNATIESFLTAMRTNADLGRRTDAVDLTTFHAAKGLEWDIVHVAGMERGLAPIAHASTPAAVAEEHRLVYVALTRARDRLHLHWAAERRFGDRTSQRSPSPFLEKVSMATPTVSSSQRLRRASVAVRAAKGSLADDGGRAAETAVEDDPLFVALQAWRSSVSRANGVPAHVIAHDETLARLVDRRPTSTAELAEMPGIGPIRAAQHGDDLLRLIGEHGAERADARPPK